MDRELIRWQFELEEVVNRLPDPMPGKSKNKTIRTLSRVVDKRSAERDKARSILQSAMRWAESSHNAVFAADLRRILRGEITWPPRGAS